MRANQGPVAFKEDRARPKREWHYLAKAHSFLAIRRKYFVTKSATNSGNNIWFHCRKKQQHNCPYALRWNKETGELFEADEHNHTNLHASRIRIYGKWHLLNGKSAKTLADICREYSLKKIGGAYFCCAKCDGKKCYFRLRRKPKEGTMFWNKKKLCPPRSKDGIGSMDVEENGIEDGEHFGLQQHQEVKENEADEEESTPPTPEVEILEEVSRELKCHMPIVKLEATAKGRQLHSLNLNRMQIAIDDEEEEQTQQPQQHWRPHLKRTVKKEEPTEVEDELLAVVGEAKGRKEAPIAQAPTKMLLRERKRQPNYTGLDGNGKNKPRSKKQ